jgi:methylenetetrahydrofolate dehydrogenase (NADP+) / methenyltetrahydrofolate cyclohydrolase
VPAGAVATISRVTARVLDGKAVAQEIYAEIAAGVAARVARGGSRPKLATVVVGDDPASAQYVRMKQKNAKQVGIDSDDHRLPSTTTTEQLLELIERLNRDDAVSGILVQQPPPLHIDMTRVIAALDPAKDVDGAHPLNVGLVALGSARGVEPCTPAGIVLLLERAGVSIEGANAVVVGRSNLVGKPTALLLLRRNATVTICHTRTKDLASHSRNADILVAAAGKANLITKEMVKPGAAVIDVGTNMVDGKQVGDLGPGVAEVAGWLTPNPGGVGPMTRAMLIKNTFEAEEKRHPLA